jgi:ribose transport system ATP-binding protein
MKVLAGAVAPDAGRIVLGGVAHGRLSPRQAMELGVGIVYQDADLVSSLTVAENVFLGMEPLGRFRTIDAARQRAITAGIIAELGVDLEPDRLAEKLSPAQRQLTQIVRALRAEPRVLVMDEPTTSLGHAEVEHLLGVVRRLADRGMGIIYISHYLGEVLALTDRVTVLKDGRTVAVRPVAGLTAPELASLMVGRTAAAFFQREPVPMGDVVLRADGLVGPGLAEPVSFELRRGEVLGFGGLVGAGRTELMELLFGSVAARGGQLVLDGAAYRPRNPRQALRAGLGMVTEDRGGSGLFRGRDVKENVAVSWTELRGAIVRGERALAQDVVRTLGVVTAGVDQEVSRLSGGNQQKVVIGRWLAVDAKVLVLDEPTKGVDIGAKQDIYRLVGELLRRGKGVLLVSSDLPELLSLSDRIAIMRAGRLVDIVATHDASEESLMRAFLGVTS